MADNSGDEHYCVGYKKPPGHSRFKPGISGNAKGRPKGAKNFATVIEKELHARIEVTENGKRKTITKKEAIAKQTVNRAAAGDAKATSILLNEARFQQGLSQLPATQAPVLGPEDQLVMNSILQRIRSSQSPFLDLVSSIEPSSENEQLSLDQSKEEA